MKLKKILCSALTVLSMVGSPLMIQAQEQNNPIEGSVLDPKGDVSLVPEEDLTQVPKSALGNITVILHELPTKVSRANVEFGLIKVADVKQGSYQLTLPFESTDTNLNAIETANEMDESAKKLIENVKQPDQTLKTSEDGTLTFENLEVGVYLIYVIDRADYEIISPALVSIPSWDSVNEKMLYELQVYPKHEPEHENVETGVRMRETNKSLAEDILKALLLLSGFGIAGLVLFTVAGKKGKKKHENC